MADSETDKAEVSAEKAYAAAAEAAKIEEAPEASKAPDSAEPLEFPAKPKRDAKVAPEVPEVVETPAVEAVGEAVLEPIVEVEKTDPPAPILEKPSRAKAVRVVPPVPAKPSAVPAKASAPVKAAPVVKPAAKPAPILAKPAPAKTVIAKTKSAPKAIEPPVTAAPKSTSARSLIGKLKETSMESTSNFTAGVSDAAASAQDKAKDAFGKATAAIGEAGEFAKGNVEALVESGKILASGIQDMGSKYVADTKSAFETITSDVKELAAVKSPTDFVKLHSEILRRNFDSAVSLGTKNTEAFFKLANDAFAPISGRVSLAVEKVRKVA